MNETFTLTPEQFLTHVTTAFAQVNPSYGSQRALADAISVPRTAVRRAFAGTDPGTLCLIYEHLRPGRRASLVETFVITVEEPNGHPQYDTVTTGTS